MPHQVVVSWLGGYKRPNDKIKAMGGEGLLLPIKKGLYIAGPIFDARPEPFLVANHILGPSYISMESALFYYGMIPERVYSIISMTIKLSKSYDTPIGRFIYTRLPLPYYSFGIRMANLSKEQTILMATPEKAICDLIVSTRGLVFRSVSSCRNYLLYNMRMEESALKELNTIAITSWLVDAPKRESLSILVKTIEKL